MRYILLFGLPAILVLGLSAPAGGWLIGIGAVLAGCGSLFSGWAALMLARKKGAEEAEPVPADSLLTPVVMKRMEDEANKEDKEASLGDVDVDSGGDVL